MDETIGFDILRAVRRIVRRVSEHSRDLSRHAGLTVPQLLVLKAIGELEADRPTVRRVSDQVQLTAATVSRIIDRLERAQLVQRERQTRDRRKVCLSLTPAGLDRYNTLPTPLQDRFLHRLASIPAAERRALLAALDRVVEMMEAEDMDAAPMLTPGAQVSEDT